MKILVTTDFSVNSKAGLRFAISLAEFRKTELIFFHSYFLPKPTSWSEATYSDYEKTEKLKLLNRFNKFVTAVYKAMNVPIGKIKCVMEQCLTPESGIMDYAESHSIDFICIATRGAGRIKKYFGTTAGNLITMSQVPVVVIPQHYKTKSITHILYASDLNNFRHELNKVFDFANRYKASIEVFHFAYPGEPLMDKNLLEANLKQYKHKIKWHLENTELTQPLVAQLQRAIASVKPSIVIMFTEQRRTFFQKVFLSSASKSIAFWSKVPLLVFNKTNK